MVQSATGASRKFVEKNRPVSVGAGSRTHQIGWIAATLAVSSMALVACGGTSHGEETFDVDTPISSTSEAQIFGGAPDSEHHSGVVALRIGETAPFEICSGALVAPNVVLTARHCVSRMVSKSVICTDKGLSANGPHVAEDHPLWHIQVFTGERPNFHARPAAVAASVVHVEGQSLCNSDIALVVLDRKLDGAAPLSVRLGKGVQRRERIRAIGYGKSDMNDGPGTRMRRDGIGVLEVGAKLTASDTALGDREFEVGRSICQGDSGGPSISAETGAVLGVVSRGADCRQDFGHVYTQTAGFEALFARATEIARTTITREDGIVLGSEDLATHGGAGEIQSGCAIGRAHAPVRASSLAALSLVSVIGLGLRRRRRASR